MAVEFYKEFGPLGFLANYSNHGFTKNGIYYKTVEHFYQSEKFDNPIIKKKIIEAETPKEASNIGRDRNNKRKENFKDIKIKVMYEGILEKFRQNPDIRSKLIETRNQEIREMTVKESFWGVGPNLDGENQIGKILMAVRDQLKEELIDRILEKCEDKKVYIVGHANPDADSVFSALILQHILKSKGINAIFSVRDENFIEKKLIEDFLEEKYVVVNNYENKYFILVDHNNLDGIPKENVIASIDHHRISNEIEDLLEIEYTSCGLLIYDLWKKRYQFSEREKFWIGLTVLTDSEYLISSRYTEEDKKLYEELQLNIQSKDYQQKYFETTNFQKSIEENLKINYKEYNYNGKEIKRSIISSYQKERETYFKIYQKKGLELGINLLIWCDYEQKKTIISYQNQIFDYPTFTTSTNLILKYLEEKKML